MDFVRRMRLLLTRLWRFAMGGRVNDAESLLALTALAQEHRLQIVRLLASCDDDGMSAGAIADTLAILQSNCSNHLQILARSNVLWTKRSGRIIQYGLNRAVIAALTDKLRRELLAEVGDEDAAAPKG